jgi:hypothetical protein
VQPAVALRVEGRRVEVDATSCGAFEHDAAQFLLGDTIPVAHQHRHGPRQVVEPEDEVEIVVRPGDSAQQRIHPQPPSNHTGPPSAASRSRMRSTVVMFML